MLDKNATGDWISNIDHIITQCLKNVLNCNRNFSEHAMVRQLCLEICLRVCVYGNTITLPELLSIAFTQNKANKLIMNVIFEHKHMLIRMRVVFKTHASLFVDHALCQQRLRCVTFILSGSATSTVGLEPTTTRLRALRSADLARRASETYNTNLAYYCIVKLQWWGGPGG